MDAHVLDKVGLAELFRSLQSGDPGEILGGLVTMPLDVAQAAIGNADDLAELVIKTITDAGFKIVRA